MISTTKFASPAKQHQPEGHKELTTNTIIQTKTPIKEINNTSKANGTSIRNPIILQYQSPISSTPNLQIYYVFSGVLCMRERIRRLDERVMSDEVFIGIKGFHGGF